MREGDYLEREKKKTDLSFFFNCFSSSIYTNHEQTLLFISIHKASFSVILFQFQLTSQIIKTEIKVYVFIISFDHIIQHLVH